MARLQIAVVLVIAVILGGCSLIGQNREKALSEGDSAYTTVYDGVGTQSEEEVVFSFITEHEKKLVLSYSGSEDRLIYRFFNKDEVELELPGAGVEPWTYFTFADDHRAGSADQLGIDMNFLVFENGNYRYEIYDNYNTAGQGRLVGVNVTNLDTQEFTHIEGDSERAIGSLMLLYERFPKLNHEHLFPKE